MSPVGLELLRQPVCLCHGHILRPRSVSFDDEPRRADVTGAPRRGGGAVPTILSTVEIDRPPAEVYAYATDATRFPTWQADVVEVSADAGSAQVGARFTTTRQIGPARRDMVQEVTEAEAPRRWAARAVGGAVRPSAAIDVRPLAGGTRSLVTFALDFEGHGPGDLLLPMVRRMAAKAAPQSYARLKELIEAGDRPTPSGSGRPDGLPAG
jgi:uncharacterized protein YndB with AHSA1/START domain